MTFSFKVEPFEHQRQIFERSRDKPAFAFFMEQGTGKTKIGIDEAAWLFLREEVTGVIITAYPQGVHSNWINTEFPKFCSVPFKGLAWSNAKSNSAKWVRQNLEPLLVNNDGILKVLATSSDGLLTKRVQDALKRFVAAHQGKLLLIVDESTAFKAPKSERKKVIMPIAKVANYRRIMSGTPQPKSPLDLWSQFQILDPSILGHASFGSFKGEYAVLKPLWGVRTKYGKAVEVVDSYRNLDQLAAKIKPYMARVLKSECLDLPEKVFKRIQYELHPKQEKLYAELMKELRIMHEDQTLTVQVAMHKTLRLMQFCQNIFMPDEESEPVPIVTDETHPRLRILLDLVETMPEDNKVIIWANWLYALREIMSALQGKFGTESTIGVWGDHKMGERERGIERWRKDPRTRFIVAHPRSLGYGYTLTEATSVIYYSNPQSLELRLQSEDRPHRIGQRNVVTYYDIEAEGTVETRILEGYQKSIDLAAQVTGDNIRRFFT